MYISTILKSSKNKTETLWLHLGTLSEIPLSGKSQLPCCEQPFGEAQAARNLCLWPAAIENLRPANSHMSKVGNGSSSSQALR